ncbi:hypothetical protein DKX38_022529 [Salix brachista]|uniref:phosphopyruvate hydratase n=1 Tax=Salix brachista TaxID=2182728 RepID=A0A5N5K4V1_9ROSI|nr:hypothetical protein DKX38_022529 [Salix brachista]
MSYMEAAMLEFPFVSIEDPFDLDDWSSWASIQSSVDIQFDGDNLVVTNPKIIAEEIQKKACNGLLMKAGLKLCQPDSHPSGETGDNFLRQIKVLLMCVRKLRWLMKGYVMASVVDEKMRELGASLPHEDIETCNADEEVQGNLP